MVDKLFKIAGVSKSEKAGAYKVRFATDMTRVKILVKTESDIQLLELPTAMEKPDVVKFLKTSELYSNPLYTEAIDNADAKYNPVAKVAVVKAKKEAKPAKAKPNLDTIKARAAKATADAAVVEAVVEAITDVAAE